MSYVYALSMRCSRVGCTGYVEYGGHYACAGTMLKGICPVCGHVQWVEYYIATGGFAA